MAQRNRLSSNLSGFLSPFSSRNSSAKPQNNNDVGFGTKLTASAGRLINRDGSFNVERLGYTSWTPYQWLVEMSWGQFFLVIFVFYCLSNAFFALLYLAVGIESLSGVQPSTFVENFGEAFFFSVQTFTTVGYGAISPEGVGANIIAATGALVGLMAFALATGLFFARFSKPRAQILFSKQAIITPYQDIMGFQFRIANIRNNKLINLEARVTMSWLEDQNGQMQRRYAPLPLERDKVFLFPLNWTIVHPITEDSPLFEKDLDDLVKMQAEFIILIQGYDETFAQNVHTTGSYTFDEIQMGVRFDSMYHAEKGRTVLELDKIDATLKLGHE